MLSMNISSATGRDKRPAFDRLLKDAAQRTFEVVMAWSVVRHGRSLVTLIGFLHDLSALWTGIQGRMALSC
jgi:DNA invertase Pin-like site-specific DNA recombinase